MKIAIFSLFRDSSPLYISEYLERAKSIKTLTNTHQYELEWFLVEGDSKAPTLDYLKEAVASDPRFKILNIRTGIPFMGSILHEARFRCLARTGNTALDVIALIDCDYVWFIDSDLLYSPSLLEHLISLGLEVVAPLFMAADAFYDIWGYRHPDGTSVGPHLSWIKSRRPIPISSAGGCVLFRHEYITSGARMTEAESIVGLCKECAKLGATIWLDPTSVVWHPIGGVANDYGIHMSKWGKALPFPYI